MADTRPSSIGGGPVALSFKLDFEDFDRFGEQIGERSRNFVPWFNSVFIPAFNEAERRQFDTQGAYFGAGSLWAVPYSDAYADYKDNLKGHLIKEVLDEQLLRALTGFDAENSIREVTGTSIRIGADVRSEEGYGYAEVQQTGARTVKGTHTRPRDDGKPSRKKRPSEEAAESKDRIPPRPVVLGSWPQGLLDDVGNSLVKYLIYGELQPVENF